MLYPHGTDFFSSSDFAALDLDLCFLQIGVFLGRQLNWRLIWHVKTIFQEKGPGKTGALKSAKARADQRE